MKSARDEVSQLHHRTCFQPMHVHELTPDQRRKVLESLIFIIEKWDGRIKARIAGKTS